MPEYNADSVCIQVSRAGPLSLLTPFAFCEFAARILHSANGHKWLFIVNIILSATEGFLTLQREFGLELILKNLSNTGEGCFNTLLFRELHMKDGYIRQGGGFWHGRCNDRE